MQQAYPKIVVEHWKRKLVLKLILPTQPLLKKLQESVALVCKQHTQKFVSEADLNVETAGSVIKSLDEKLDAKVENCIL